MREEYKFLFFSKITFFFFFNRVDMHLKKKELTGERESLEGSNKVRFRKKKQKFVCVKLL